MQQPNILYKPYILDFKKRYSETRNWHCHRRVILPMEKLWWPRRRRQPYHQEVAALPHCKSFMMFTMVTNDRQLWYVKYFTRYVLVADNSFSFLTTRRCGSKILFVCMYQIYEKTLPFKSSCEWFWTRSDSCVFFRIFKKMSNVSAAFKRVGRQ